jgi:hypothetical protein
VVRAGRRRLGASRLGCLLQLLIVAGLLYVAKMAGEDALMYYRLQDAMRNEAIFATARTDAEILTRLKAFSDSVKVPAQAKDISVVRDENSIRIWSDYDINVKLPMNHSKTIHLHPSAERKF